MSKFKMMTAAEIIELLFKVRELSFTFDDIELIPDTKPSNWYGIKLTRLFDEEGYVLAIGYYGGGSTTVYDLTDATYDFFNNISAVKKICVEKLQEFINNWGEYHNSCEKVCVEMPDISNETECDEYRRREREYHREDVISELETEHPYRSFSKEEITAVLNQYEKNLSNSDDWHYRLTEAIHTVLNL